MKNSKKRLRSHAKKWFYRMQHFSFFLVPFSFFPALFVSDSFFLALNKIWRCANLCVAINQWPRNINFVAQCHVVFKFGKVLARRYRFIPDFPHEVEEHLVHVLPGLCRRLDVGDLPCVGPIVGLSQPDLPPVGQVALVADEDERNAVVALDAKDLLAELLRCLKM